MRYLTMNDNIKKIITPLIAFIAGFVVAYTFFGQYKAKEQNAEFEQAKQQLETELETQKETNIKKEKEILSDEKILAQSAATSTNENNFDYIKVSDQKASKKVEVANVKAEQPVWIVIHMEKDGKIWNALGARRKEAGEYTGVVVPLLAPTTKGAKYWAVLYADNGDKEFSLDKDFPLKNADGEFIMVDFKAI